MQPASGCTAGCAAHYAECPTGAGVGLATHTLEPCSCSPPPNAVGLQALCFMEAGRTYVPAKPWNPGEESKWVAAAHLLPPTVHQFVDRFRSQQAPEAAAAAGAGAGTGGA